MASVDDYVNRRIAAHSVAIQPASVEDRSICAHANLVVERRGRQNFYVVDYTMHARNPRHSTRSVVARRSVHDLAVERNGIAFDLIRKIVEDTVIGQHHKLVTHLL